MTTIEKSRGVPDRLLTYEQLANSLNDSIRHLRRLVNEDKIPYIKVGHFIRFDAMAISHWLEARRYDPMD
jgi:excisionase family DNA binding protein